MSVQIYKFLRRSNFHILQGHQPGVPYWSREEELDVKRRNIRLRGSNPIDISMLGDKHTQLYRYYKEKFRHAVEDAQSRQLIARCVLDTPRGDEMKFQYNEFSQDISISVPRLDSQP